MTVMTEDDARMLGKAIKEAAGLVSLPIENDKERRLLCLKLAIETKNVAFSLKNDGTVAEAAEQVLVAASMYDDFVSGASNDDA